MTDSPPGENSLPLSLPLEEMEEERENSWRFSVGEILSRGGDFRGGISLVRVGDVDDDSSADM